MIPKQSRVVDAGWIRMVDASASTNAGRAVTLRIACIGEAMVELSLDAALDSARIGFAGDALNTAIYLRRELGPDATVAFVSAIGTDALSDRMAAMIAAEGVDTAHLARDPTRSTGLYAIRTDPDGERHFSYWRDTSAARAMFAGTDPFAVLDRFDVLLLTATSFAILPPDTRVALLDRIATFRRRGGLFAFDSNYRPRLWGAVQEARVFIERVWRATDIALPSVDDEMAIFDDRTTTDVLARLRHWGVRRGALKCGALGPLALSGVGEDQTFAAADRVADTTAAGDSFNAGYLAAILSGKDEAMALRSGHACAVKVIGHRGAIVPIASWR
jgi:2-dehydro-3-deoxygluconokinase